MLSFTRMSELATLQRVHTAQTVSRTACALSWRKSSRNLANPDALAAGRGVPPRLCISDPRIG